ncbi:hypothetical protein ACODT5_15900 [Streptomyces sp. 5.8]|uniref:hypothetical protein n=1 Tax=Streptomyces sp. 5.8 TaxID=3406571 RepID=UPI003BB7FED1
MSASALSRLDEQLDSEDASAVLAAAWDVFDMITKLAHSITFDEGSDELQAMVVSQQCAEGRDRLPLPGTSLLVTAPPPEPGAAGLAPYVRLLEHVSAVLTRLSAGEVADAASARALVEVGELASGAAVALSFVRGQ